MGPFEEHLKDAIRINQARAPLYSALSGGRSDSISKYLLWSEQCSLPFAQIPDRWAKPFLDRGVPIVREEFMPMSGVPEFLERFTFDPEPLSAFEPKQGHLIASRIGMAYHRGGFLEASLVSTRELEVLNRARTFHFMLKHVLESVIRVCNLASLHESYRLSLGIKSSTLPLSKWLFFSHFGALPFSTWIDQKAAPLQSEGLPLIYQDVPAIPPKSQFYSEK